MSRWMVGWQPCRDQAEGTDCKPVNRLPREGPRSLWPDCRYLPRIGRGSGCHHGAGRIGLGVRPVQLGLPQPGRAGEACPARCACTRLLASLGVAGAAAGERTSVTTIGREQSRRASPSGAPSAGHVACMSSQIQLSECGGRVTEMQALQRDRAPHQLLSVQSPLSTLRTIWRALGIARRQ